MRALSWLVRGTLGSLALVACLACGASDEGGDVGSPCEEDEDCQPGLLCDVHDGRGSCQEPHHHHDESESGDHDHGHAAP
jgi:hypothetical protein